MLENLTTLTATVIFMILIIMVIKAWMVYKLYHSLTCPYCHNGKLKFLTARDFRMKSPIYECSNCKRKIIMFQEYNKNAFNDEVVEGVGLKPDILNKKDEAND